MASKQTPIETSKKRVPDKKGNAVDITFTKTGIPAGAMPKPKPNGGAKKPLRD